MKFYQFSFKNEAIWLMLVSLAGLAGEALILLAVWFLRSIVL